MHPAPRRSAEPSRIGSSSASAPPGTAREGRRRIEAVTDDQRELNELDRTMLEVGDTDSSHTLTIQPKLPATACRACRRVHHEFHSCHRSSGIRAASHLRASMG